MNLLSTPHFQRKVGKIIKTNPKLVEKIDKTLILFQSSPQHPSLRIHKLTGVQNQAWSISINRSIRVIFHYIPEGALFTDIGSHDEVY